MCFALLPGHDGDGRTEEMKIPLRIIRGRPTLARFKQGKRRMITLYHCHGARSFRPLWMLEEMRLPYELKMLPFPPRVFAKEYLSLNPLGTIPLMIDGANTMT